MPNRVLGIPEICALDTSSQLIRIPPDTDVPLTPRVRALMDTRAFRRLARITQLGLVSLVYPAAHHTRFEHALGVFHLALLYLRKLAHDPRFTEAVSEHDALCFIVAALLHDIGHWPFCHAIEEMELPDVPAHEQFAQQYLADAQVAGCLRRDWSIEPEEVLVLLTRAMKPAGAQILSSMLDGPIDVDKMDYLPRDSLHAGVPYGRHFDRARLIASLCLNAQGDQLAITQKGRTAAEMMVFARYVMFSEVYWHHAVRSATAMLQRACYQLHQAQQLTDRFRETEMNFVASCFAQAADDSTTQLLEGLFGSARQLYKRWAEYSCLERADVHQRLARRPYHERVHCGNLLARRLSARLGQKVEPHEVLLDAPPARREVQFAIDVYYPSESCYRPLRDVSPVTRTLAEKQFDDYVKQVRVFVHPRLRDACPNMRDRDRLLVDALEEAAADDAPG